MSEHGGGGYVEGIANLGLTPTVDLRLVPRVAFGSIPLERQFAGTVREAPDWIPYAEDSSPQTNAFAIIPSALVAVRLNLTSRYSMMLGFRAGLEAYVAGESAESGKDDAGLLQYEGSSSPASAVRAHVGPELSPLSLQLGSRRELEIECWQGLLIDSMPSLQVGLGVRYLLLP
jgi:hypothetical protein